MSVDTDLQNHFAKLTIRLDESNKRTVKFQEDTTTPKPVLAPAAAAMWRQSRSSLQTSMKAGVCSEWLSNLCQSDIATPWAAGLHPLPPYCREDQVLCKTIVNIRKKAALQIQQCTAAYLKEKDITEKETSRPTTLLIAAEKVSRDNPTALDNTIDITSSMVSPTKAALIRDLQERKSYLSQCQLTEKDRLNIDWIGGSPRSIHLGENENPIDVTPLGPTLESSTTTRKSSAPWPSRYPNTSRTRQDTNKPHFNKGRSSGGNPQQRRGHTDAPYMRENHPRTLPPPQQDYPQRDYSQRNSNLSDREWALIRAF